MIDISSLSNQVSYLHLDLFVTRSLLLSEAVIGPIQCSEKGTSTNEITEETHSASLKDPGIINHMEELQQKTDLQLNVSKPNEQLLEVTTDIAQPTFQVQTENSSVANYNDTAKSTKDTDFDRLNSSNEFNFLSLPGQPNMVTPLLAISPLPSPPPSPSINFFQVRFLQYM